MEERMRFPSLEIEDGGVGGPRFLFSPKREMGENPNILSPLPLIVKEKRFSLFFPLLFEEGTLQ